MKLTKRKKIILGVAGAVIVGGTTAVIVHKVNERKRFYSSMRECILVQSEYIVTLEGYVDTLENIVSDIVGEERFNELIGATK